MNTREVVIVLSIVVVVSGVLCYFTRISGDQFVNIVMYILGLISGGAIMKTYIMTKIKKRGG
ncbi:MAG: hypothetical protein DRP01_03920 [Archaeoglobales archaeon]|nr:MAG: hypothetical protein DRP01_03920 [Archaeoglobales archaeon]